MTTKKLDILTLKDTRPDHEIEKELKAEWKIPKTFNKLSLKRLIEVDCLRQAFLYLPNTPQWRNPVEKPKPRIPKRAGSEFAMKQGHEYEQQVYGVLKKIPNCVVKYSKKYVVKRTITPQFFEDLFEICIQNNYSKVILLEAEFDTGEDFFKHIFPPKHPQDPLPVQYSKFRPDIIAIKRISLTNPKKKSITCINHKNKMVNINRSNASSKPIFGISIIDIKHVLEPNVGKSHFIEILFYLHAFAYYLHKYNLDDKFRVISEGNGILPRLDPADLKQIRNLNDLTSNIIEMDWKNVVRLYERVLKQYQELWQQAPCSIDDIDLKIQPLCGSCQFLNDCLYRLGIQPSNPPENWSLEVIPYTNPSVIMQLKQHGFKTIGDVAKNIHTIKIGSTPQPIYAEIPFLKQRAEAIIQDKPIYPPPQKISSYAIPKYSPISMIITCESDPLNERVFGLGLRLEISVPKKSKNYPLLHQWWKTWKNGLQSGKPPSDILKDLQQVNPFYSSFPQKNIDKLHSHFSNTIPIEIIEAGQTLPSGKPATQTKAKYHFEVLSQSVSDPHAELKLILLFMEKLVPIIEICSILEDNLVLEERRVDPKTRKEFFLKYKLDFSVFYWAQDQIKNLQEMMERNLEKLIKLPKFHQKLLEIIQYFTPAESEVEHPHQHHKLFDLQKFTETVVGYPAIINYTWHEISEMTFSAKFKKKFWLRNFNYMDYQVWYEFLETQDLTKKQQLGNEILKQLARKTKFINLLRKKFQFHGSNSIPRESKPVSHRAFKEIAVPTTYHKIAELWYFFARLTGAVQELEVEEIRTMYPEFSIGKLNAAEVHNLQFIQNPANDVYYYIFEIRNLSSNMKIKEKDRVLLIPNELRERRLGIWVHQWTVNIEKMIWNSKKNGFIIKTARKKADLMIQYQQLVPKPLKNPRWFLYPLSLDVWSAKLYKGDGTGLLENNHFGESLMGYFLAINWGIDKLASNSVTPTSAVYNFQLPEIYLYDPLTLLKIPVKPKSAISSRGPIKTSLMTESFPTPDPSQAEAILKALNSYIYAIQGPPGTGKSQTITALIDEYICRIRQNKGKKTQIKILVTAFSYAALRVLIDKIRSSRDSSGKPTKVASVQLIFLHSESVEPIPDEPSLAHVDDLMHKFSGSWQWNGQKRVITKTKPLQEVLEDQFILFGNAHQLFHLPSITKNELKFDLIVVDEASQVPTDHFLASLQFAYPHSLVFTQNQTISASNSLQWSVNLEENDFSPNNYENMTQVVIVGDYFQLPPVQPVEPPKKVEPILGSLYSYYVQHHGIPQSQLQINYRSHPDIVEFTKELSLYQNLKAFFPSSSYVIKGSFPSTTPSWILEIFQPERVVCSIIHDNDFEIAISQVEAFLVSQIAAYYYISQKITTKEAERAFWLESIGIVSPHNAQGRLILRQIFAKMTNSSKRLTLLDDDELMECLQATVYSVEKFQGSDRELIIASIGISDKEHLKKEEEFIYDLNRFNVLTSRAKKKLIYICSKNFLEYIPHDKNLIDYAAQSYKYTVEFCNHEKPLFLLNHLSQMDFVYFRWHDDSVKKTDKPFSSFKFELTKINDTDFQFSATENSDFLAILRKYPEDKINISENKSEGLIRGNISITDSSNDYKLIPALKMVNRSLIQNASSIQPVTSQQNTKSSSIKEKAAISKEDENKTQKKPAKKLIEKKISVKLTEEDEELF